MAVKGQIITHNHYDREQRYIKVLQAACWRGELPENEIIGELRAIGFSAVTANVKFKEWSANKPQLAPERKGVMNKRQKDMAFLKKYFFKKKRIRKWTGTEWVNAEKAE